MAKYTHEEIEAMLDAVTPGEWYWRGEGKEKLGLVSIDKNERQQYVIDVGRDWIVIIKPCDSVFIAHSKDIIRQLLAENKVLLASLAEAKAADSLSQVPPFDWGPEGEPEGKPISYSVNGVKFDWDEGGNR